MELVNFFESESSIRALYDGIFFFAQYENMGKKLKYLKQYIYNTWGFLLTNYKGKKIYIFTHQRILSSNIHKYEKINMFHKKYLQIVIDNKDLFVTQHYIILDKNAKQNIILKKLF